MVIYSFYMKKLFKSIFEYNCKADYSWTHIKEIPNTPYLVSLHHSYYKSANIEIFDISNKGKIKKIFSLGKLNGGNNIMSSIAKTNQLS